MRNLVKTLVAAAMVAAPSVVSAVPSGSPIAPMFDAFGDLPGATFGGSGIPTDPTAITRFTGIGTDEVILGLAATPRFANPSLGNDGAGTYTAGTGLNDGTPGSTSGTLGATWNFSFYTEVIDNGGGSELADYGIELLFDFDPGANTLDTGHGRIFGSAPGTLAEGSQNAAFSFLAGSIPGVLDAPAVTPFDPFAAGEYTFALRSTTYSEMVAIRVNVVAPVPLPAGMLLLLTGAGGLALLRRRNG